MTGPTLDESIHSSRFEAFVESPWFRHFITSLIIVNAVILGALTYHKTLSPPLVNTLQYADTIIAYIFAVEIGLKLLLYRMLFFKSGWHWFDLIVVGVSLVPVASTFNVLRAMRVLRILRLLHVIPTLKRITEALFKAMPGMGAIVAILALVTYVGAVMATHLFGDTDDPEVAQLFGDLPSSAYSLFQVMTMDGWRFEVAQKVIDDGNPYAWIFFLIFIFIASFAILNLFIALVVDAMRDEQIELIEELEEEIEEGAEIAHNEREQILSLLSEMRDEIASLKAELKTK